MRGQDPLLLVFGLMPDTIIGHMTQRVVRSEPMRESHQGIPRSEETVPPKNEQPPARANLARGG